MNPNPLSNQQIIEFYSGPYRLVGTLHLPDRTPAPVIIGCHGLIANRQSPKQIALARACCDHGIAYFRFDHHGCGDSQGDFAAGAALKIRCRDLECAASALAGHPGLGPLLGLFGSSFGGTVAIFHAHEHPVSFLVTYAAPITSEGLGVSQVSERLTPTQQASLSKTWDFDIRGFLSTQRNILVIHAEKDAIVPMDHAREIYRQARDPKRLIIQNGGDHPMSDPSLQSRFLSQAVDWYQRAMWG